MVPIMSQRSHNTTKQQNKTDFFSARYFFIFWFFALTFGKKKSDL